MNLGMYDFFPSLAGKGPVVRFLQAKWGLKRDECIALFDDDNDIKMVQEVRVHPGCCSSAGGMEHHAACACQISNTRHMPRA
jgi:hydroxymethylpyrimidine pyrophosphatase-like HAD family hydrolase